MLYTFVIKGQIRIHFSYAFASVLSFFFFSCSNCSCFPFSLRMSLLDRERYRVVGKISLKTMSVNTRLKFIYFVLNMDENTYVDNVFANDSVKIWTQENKVCRHYSILSTFSNELFDVYYNYKEANDI